jgi:hypothetical protein
VGLFIAEDGGDAKTGTCFQALAAHPPFADEDGDTCGDIKARVNVVQTLDVEVSCSAADASGHLLIPVCRTWKQPGANTVCSTITDTAGTGSKCDCTPFTTDILVQSPCENVDCSTHDTACTTASCDPEGAPGNCDGSTPKAAGTACGDPSSSVCDNPDTCDAAGNCQVNHVANGNTCTSDGNDCTNDVCSNGLCTHTNKTDGTACGSQTQTQCDNPDTCVGGACQPNYVANGTACNADNNRCTADLCDGAGTCVGNAGGPVIVPE